MTDKNKRRILITDADLERLTELLEQGGNGRDAASAELLEQELARAEVVRAQDIPPDVVTMNSTVRFEDERTGEQKQVTLVYPKDAQRGNGNISILAPIGTALLGLSVGQTIEWPLPGGRTKSLRVVEVIYQPEAAGHLHL